MAFWPGDGDLPRTPLDTTSAEPRKTEVPVIAQFETLNREGTVTSRVEPIGHPPRRVEALHDFECASCGYGAVARVAPERCPMCSGSVWSPSAAPDQRDMV
jgi:predicted Zn-ribbon and HTH transcriptional regulator